MFLAGETPSVEAAISSTRLMLFWPVPLTGADGYVLTCEKLNQSYVYILNERSWTLDSPELEHYYTFSVYSYKHIPSTKSEKTYFYGRKFK